MMNPKALRAKMQFNKKIKNTYPNLKVLTPYQNAQTKITVKCLLCGHTFERIPRLIFRNHTKYGCPFCNIQDRSKKRRTPKEKFIEALMHKRPNIKYLSGYISMKKRAKFKCLRCNCIFTAYPTNVLHHNRYSCPKCSINLRAHEHTLPEHEYEEKFNEKFPNLTLLSKYINSRTPIIVRCNICGHTWNSKPLLLLNRKIGCSICANKQNGIHSRKKADEFEKEISQIAPNLRLLSPYVMNKRKVLVQCKKCNYKWYVRPNDLISGYTTCKKCFSFSKGEQHIIKILNENNIKYQIGFKPKGLVDKSNLHYDFKIKNTKILIEFNGKQHYQPIKYFGGTKQFNIQQKHDQMKKEWAYNNGYQLFIIKYNDNLQQQMYKIIRIVSHYKETFHNTNELNNKNKKEY